MAGGGLKQQAFNGMIWMFMEKMGKQIVSFVISIVLARILLPDDYGIVALAMIFINIANVFILQGLNASLIQRKESGDLEYSTVFVANLTLSILLYVVLFIISPLIAEYYGKELLTPIFRVLALRLPIGAINSVQMAYVSRNLQFKKFFFSTLSGTVVSGCLGIWMALIGFGPWTIVWQSLINLIINTIVLWFTVGWRPKRMFSFAKLKDMFGFSWKILASVLFNEFYLELRSIMIGKEYSVKDLAYYNRGKHFPELFYMNIVSAITSVMFPVMSMKKDNDSGLKSSLSSALRVSSYAMFPALTGLAMIAVPLVKLLITDKWLPCVPFMQAYCISYAILPIQSIQEQLYKAKGRSDIVLKLFFIEKSVGIAIIIITMNISIWAIAVGMVITSFFATLVHTIPMKRVVDYSLWDLVRDLIPSVLMSAGMAGVIFLLGLLPGKTIIILSVQVAGGIIFYLMISLAIRSKSLKMLIDLANNKFHFRIIKKIENAFYK